MLTLILADSELEVVPQDLLRHPSVKSHAKRRGKNPGKLLLDSSVHHRALEGVEDGERRGRPDLVHFFLLLCQDSIANLEGGLQTFVHTRNNELIHIRPDTRIPKNYNRFVGLMEDLFEKGAVPPGEGEPLLWIESGKGLEAVLRELKPDTMIALSPDGKREHLHDVFGRLGADKHLCCIIGGFTKGDFRSPIYELADEKTSISDELLKVWTVAAEVLAAYRLSCEK